MELITGRTGQQHVYAIDDAEIYKMFLGSGDFILPTGNQLSASMVGANTVRVFDGSIMMQGRLAKIRPADGYDTLTLDNGTAGYKRVDLIVAEYSQYDVEEVIEMDSGPVPVTETYEQVILKVVKGSLDAAQYIEPSITTGNIDAGDTHQVKLFAVQLDGINFNALIDYRVMLTTNPIDPLLDTVNGEFANIWEQIQTTEGNVYSYINTLNTGALDRFSGIFRGAFASQYDVTQDMFVVNMGNAYDYDAGDYFVAYINGLLVPTSEYSVADSGVSHSVAITFTDDISLKADEDVIEIVAYRYGSGGGGGSVSPYTSNPAALGTASPGSSDKYARGDHIHPKPTAADLGITVPSAATATPSDLGTAAVGSSSKYAKEDHVHNLPSNATTLAAGLMSSTDKGRLDDLYADYSSALTALGVI